MTSATIISEENNSEGGDAVSYKEIEYLLRRGVEANNAIKKGSNFESLKTLLEPGKVENLHLKNNLDLIRLFNSGELPEELLRVSDRGEECNLCKIYKDVFRQYENIFFETDELYVVDTPDKDHETRYMIGWKEQEINGEKSHTVYPSKEELEENIDEALKFTFELAAKSVENGFIAVYAGMNTFTHPHIIVSDVTPDDPEKLKDVNNFLLYKVEDSEVDLTQPVEIEFGDTVGEAYLERVYNAAFESAPG